MKYCSTRGGQHGASFETTLMTGLPVDGGRFMPESVPEIDQPTLRDWAKLTYPAMVQQIFGLFVDPQEVPPEDIADIVTRALSRFDIPEVVRVAPLRSGLSVLELFHGQTLAFKDLALSCVGQMLQYFLKRRGKHANVIVATSGDTGSAAIECVRGLPEIDITVLLPRGRITATQERQMTTVLEPNVHVFRVDGTSEELDGPMLAVFADHEFAKRHDLSCINSVNWARIMVQIAHIFYAYLQMAPDCDGEVEVILPTGGMGNASAAVVAQAMGLPVRLKLAVNSNGTLPDILSTGLMSVDGDLNVTLAPAMDIKVPYNIERIIHSLCPNKSDVIKSHFDEFDKKGNTQLPADTTSQLAARLSSETVTDEEIRATMQRCWRENNYLVCPHTATALHCAYRAIDSGNESDVRRICLATASPAKFEEAVLSAGLTPQIPDKIKDLASMPTRYLDMEKDDDWEKMLRDNFESIYSKRQSAANEKTQ